MMETPKELCRSAFTGMKALEDWYMSREVSAEIGDRTRVPMLNIKPHACNIGLQNALTSTSC